MAITYHQQPSTGSIQSSDDPIGYVFSSNQTGQPNFCFIVDVLINGVIVSNDMVYPERGNKAHFDAIKTTLSSIVPIERGDSLVAIQNLATLQIRVSERYGTTPATYPFSQSNVCKLAKASTDEETFISGWLTANYPPDQKWLTDAPDSTILVSRRYPIWCSIFNTSPQVLINVNCYDANDDFIAALSSSIVTGGDKVNVCVLPDDLNAMLDPLTMEDVHRMEIYMNESDPLFVNFIEEDCGEFYQLSWLNNLGGHDQFLFTHNRDQESAITIHEYKKQFGRWSDANEFKYDPIKGGDTPYLKVIQPTGTLYSGWIPEAYQNWMAQIFYSVDHILLVGDAIEKLGVTNTSATLDKSRFNDILNFQVNYKKTNFKSLTK